LVDYKDKHYAHLTVTADWGGGVPKNMEPEKGGEWKLYDLDDLPQPRFATLDKSILAYKTGRNFFDSK